MSRREKFSDTGLCVRCGLCLPHCPTYDKSLDENESPRGRLSLIQAWAGNHLPANRALLDHLDNCLLCRACERVCPARVPYGRLMDDFRAETVAAKRPSLPVAALKTLVISRNRLKLARLALQKYRRSSAQVVIRKLGVAKLAGLGNLERLLPEPEPGPGKWRESYPAVGTAKGRVGLFVGCMERLAGGGAVDAAIGVLTRLGFEVHIPTAQSCCGALHLHAGDTETASSLAQDNLAAFDAEGLCAIISLASGCGATLKEYPVRREKAESFSGKIRDISHFLAETEWPADFAIAPLHASACLHTPCTLKNVLRQENGVERLLERIPGLEVAKLPGASRCCGSSGSYLLEHPAMAETLRQDLVDQIETLAPDFLVSSNIGCLLHLSAGLQEKEIAVEALHPMVLLARQLMPM